MPEWLEESVTSKYLKYMRLEDQIRTISKITCFPLYSLLLALGNPTVDFFFNFLKIVMIVKSLSHLYIDFY